MGNRASEIAVKYCRSHRAILMEREAGGGCHNCFQLKQEILDLVAAEADAAVRAERERCAKVAGQAHYIACLLEEIRQLKEDR